MSHPEIQAEQAHIDRAYALLETSRQRVTRLRDMVEVGRGGTRQARFERDVIEDAVAGRLSQLELGSSSLVFGRIDRSERPSGDDDKSDGSPDGNGASETFYIGRLAVADERQEPVVVDWRAPIAEPFFRATGGDPLGLLRRRHFVCRGRVLADLEDEFFDLDALDGESGDGHRSRLNAHGALYAALEQRRDGQLRQVVATIQAEQDEIIRSPRKGILVTQGGPGTGKTIVALHRAAYLLYTYRFPLAGQGVLVVGPNRLFLRYVERVLPSLGEAGVHLFVLADLFNEIFPDVRVRLADTADVARVKGDVRMSQVVKNAVRDRQRPLRGDLRLDFGLGYVTLAASTSRAIVAEARRRFRHHNAGRAYVEQAVYAAMSASHRRRPEPSKLRERFSRHPDVMEAFERMWPLLTPAQLLRDLYGSRALLRSAADGALADAETEQLYRPRGDSEADYEWSDADVPVLDEAYSVLGPRSRSRRRRSDTEMRTYGHIVVDECQDQPPMALRMIARRSLNGSMTLVGDIAQATSAHAPSSWHEILAHLPSGPVAPRLSELTLSYRIPQPSLELANQVLAAAAPGLAPPAAVRIDGSPPRFVTAPEDVAQAVLDTVVFEAAELDGGSMLVVSPAECMDDIAELLASAGVDFGRATAASRNATGALHPHVTLAPVRLCKGLETDGVVVVEPAAMVDEEPQGLRALYVALTRATKRVAVVSSRPLPEPLHSAAASYGAGACNTGRTAAHAAAAEASSGESHG
ncbi:MAG: AAA family ATPase [Acidimicrobiales bacterium]|nr:AAA family ATPase [Acidimicrobiales bacterium]MYJ48524.1 AAA family ATPase [Acidimicrobiales bacterium]